MNRCKNFQPHKIVRQKKAASQASSYVLPTRSNHRQEDGTGAQLLADFLDEILARRNAVDVHEDNGVGHLRREQIPINVPRKPDCLRGDN
jgi:hypothetical protein